MYSIVGFNVPLDTLGWSFRRRFYGSDESDRRRRHRVVVEDRSVAPV